MKTTPLVYFVAGQLVIPSLASLPSWPLYGLLWCLPLVCWRWVYWRNALMGLLLGAGLANFQCYALLGKLLTPDQENIWLTVVGTIDGLPSVDARRVQFRLRVADSSIPLKTDSLLLSYYPQSTGSPPSIEAQSLDELRTAFVPGRVLQATVKLKRPRGLANSGGFNYEAWLLAEGIHAVGYARELRWRDSPADIEISSSNKLSGKLFNSLQDTVERKRMALGHWLALQGPSLQLQQVSLLRALLIGDKSQISKSQWQVLVATGTVHLLVISGLHIGFVAGLGWLLGVSLGRCLLLLQLLFIRQFPGSAKSFGNGFNPSILGLIAGLGAALVYSQLAGFTVATQRALIMLSLFYLAIFVRRTVPPMRVLVVAAALVLWFDPLAGYRAGFWLSFGIVGLLLLCFAHRYRVACSSALVSRTSRWLRAARQYLASFTGVQWVIFLGTVFPLLFLLNQFTLLAPVANLIAVPIVTVAVVPPLLLGAAMQSIAPEVSGFLLRLAGGAVDGLWSYLTCLSDLTEVLKSRFTAISNLRELQGLLRSVSWPWVLAGTLGCLWLVSPRGWPLRRLSLLLVLCGGLSAFAFKQERVFAVHVLDVGQGLAVVIIDGSHTLVFDTGARFSERFDIGANVIVPFLQGHGISVLDKVIVSHNDGDHSGGLNGLLAALPVNQIISGEHNKLVLGNGQSSEFNPVEPCVDGAYWRWGQQRYELVNANLPQGDAISANNASCGLLITGPELRIFMPGDIEAVAEQALLRRSRLPANLDLLVAPHHGSKTSSSVEFVRHVAAKHVVFSSGYLNRYGHPHAAVVERYLHTNSQPWQTALHGAVEFRWSDNGLAVNAQRLENPHFWYLSE